MFTSNPQFPDLTLYPPGSGLSSRCTPRAPPTPATGRCSGRCTGRGRAAASATSSPGADINTFISIFYIYTFQSTTLYLQYLHNLYVQLRPGLLHHAGGGDGACLPRLLPVPGHSGGGGQHLARHFTVCSLSVAGAPRRLRHQTQQKLHPGARCGGGGSLLPAQ